MTPPPLIDIITEEEVKDGATTARADSVFEAEPKVDDDDAGSVTTEYRTVISAGDIVVEFHSDAGSF